MVKRVRLTTAVVLAGSLLGYSLWAQGAGFAIIEQSVPGMGNAFAGGAASANDATTIWFNPAGMTRIEGTQFIGALHVIKPNIQFDNEDTRTSTPFGSVPIQGGEGSDAGTTAAIPNLYYKRDLWDSRLQFGFGVSVPFGQNTDYGDDWVGRYHAMKTELRTININPALAMKVWKGLSVGAGASALYGDAHLTRKIDAGAAVGATGLFDLFIDIDDADDLTFTGNAGALYEFTERTRVGVHYRSNTELELRGNARFKYASSTPTRLKATLQAGGLRNTGVETDLKLPDTVELGAYHAFNDRFAVLLGSTWYNWDRLDVITLEFDTGVETEIEFDYKDTWRHSLGATYTTKNDLIWRVGIAYDESPVRGSRTRLPNLPDNDRYWATAGLTWAPSDRLKLDVAYAHLFLKDTNINNTVESAIPGVTHTLKGEYDSDVDLISAQLTYNFD